MGRKRVVVIEGEDAAPEAVRPTIALIDWLGPDIEWLHPPVGDAGIAQHGSPFPEEARRAIDASDATLFGATSGKSAAALFYLRWGKRTYANVCPARWVPGYRSPPANPQGIDFVIVRENLEDLGFTDAARRLAPAVERVCAECRCLTRDQGGNASTTRFCEAVARCL